MVDPAQVEQSPTDRLERLARTADDLRDAVGDRDDRALSRRAAPEEWSAKDVICHLRDVEELVILRFHTMLAMDEPRVLVVGAPPIDPAAWGFDGAVPFPMDADRWRDERQYERNDPAAALSAFARRRGEVLTLLGGLSPAQWERGALHPDGARWTFADWTAGMARHDDAHLEQLRRALAG
jgi:hypothetical protein